FSSIFIRNKSNNIDYIFFATDSVSVYKQEGWTEKYASITSKNLYIPHLKTCVAVLGSSWLAIKLHLFIDNQRRLDTLDGLIVSINHRFTSFYESEAKEIEFDADPENSNFLGSIILSGPSYFDINQFYNSIDGELNKRDRPLLMTR